MEGLWTIVLFGAVVPAGMMATLALLDRRAACEHVGGHRQVDAGDGKEAP